MRVTAPHEELTASIIGWAMRVHEHFGPGLIESVYQRAVAIELQYAGFSIEAGSPLSVSLSLFSCVFARGLSPVSPLTDPPY